MIYVSDLVFGSNGTRPPPQISSRYQLPHRPRIDIMASECRAPHHDCLHSSRNLEPGDTGQVYFQDIESYRLGVRYNSPSKSDYAQFSAGSENELGHLFEYERALDELLRCSLKRRRAAERERHDPLP